MDLKRKFLETKRMDPARNQLCGNGGEFGCAVKTAEESLGCAVKTSEGRGEEWWQQKGSGQEVCAAGHGGPNQTMPDKMDI